MAVTVTSTISQRMTYLLSVSGESGNVELLRWTFSPSAVTSSVGLDSDWLGIIKDRIDTVLAPVAAAERPNFTKILEYIVSARDISGTLVASVNPQETYHAYEIGNCDPGLTYRVYVSIPLSSSPYV